MNAISNLKSPAKKVASALVFLAMLGVGVLPTASAQTNLTAREKEIVAAVALDRVGGPRFNSPAVIGIHPGMQLVQAIAVSGTWPMRFSAKKLPDGLHLDEATGILTGTLAKAGQFNFTVIAQNSAGTSGRTMQILCGGKLAQTPPMGWNSYDAFGDSVTEEETLANAMWMKEHLLAVGWNTIVVDFRWYDPQPTGDDSLLNKTRVGAALTADEFSRLFPSPNRFPSATNAAGFKPLADKLHSMGLKFGIHVMRGIPRQAVLANTKILGGQFTAAEVGSQNDKCAWCPDMFGVHNNAAGQAWYDSCVQLWALWGVDYIKVDDLSEPYHASEIEQLRRALDKFGKSIVFSTSPGPTTTSRAGHIAAHANLWRISGDFWDRWQKLNEQFDLLAQWQGAGGAGHWPDADMIPLGKIAIRSKLGGNEHWTHFTRDEQLTLMSLWALAPSPLMLGMNLPENDDWTTALLTNPEVMAVNQDALGQPAQRKFSVGQRAEVWARELSGGVHVVGFFNRTGQAVTVDYNWINEGFSARPKVRDLWLRKDLPKAKVFTATIPPHGSVLLRVD